MRNLPTLFPYFKPYRWHLAAGIFFMVLSNSAKIFEPLIIAHTIDLFKLGETNIFPYLLALILAAAISSMSRFYIRKFIIMTSRDQEFDIRQKLWKHLQGLPDTFFKRKEIGKTMAHLTNDLDATRMFFGPVTMYTIDNIMRFLFYFCMLSSFKFSLTLASMAPLILLVFLIHHIMPKIHKRFGIIQESFGKLTSQSQQAFSGIRVVQAYGREEAVQDRFQATSEAHFNKHLELAQIDAIFRPLIFLIPSFSAIIILWYGGNLVIEDQLTIGELTAFMVCLAQLVWPMVALGWVISQAQRADASTGRINELLAEKSDIVELENPIKLDQVNGSLEFKDVGLKIDDVQLLKNINLKIEPGKFYALMGPTGSGKSLLLKMIPRLIDANSGVLLLEGIKLKDLSLSSLRSYISYAPQEPFLFSDTLKNNICFANPKASEEEIKRALHLSQFEKDLEQFSDGLETEIGERGVTLSGGQKQRCALARALLDPRPILLLDDTFSAVDTETEEAIISSLTALTPRQTVIMVTHRCSTAGNADYIIMLDKDGMIAEQGVPQALYEKAGPYRSLCDKQRLESELERID
ncbi:MAG: ABC transporter ATP-binding protein/permease [Lentisphaeria bacterium]|nr:ABC transporter ATP-binding protein/permease [Lentisphaeria bacterium]